MHEDRRISGTFICPDPVHKSCSVKTNATAVINSEGSITSVSDALATDEPNSVWMPGFVDTHVHFPQHRVRARSSGALLPWLEQTVFPEEAKFISESYAAQVAQEFCDALIRHGTTCAHVFSSSDEQATDQLFSALERRGLRAQVGLTLMDQGAPDELCVGPEKAELAIRRLVRRWHGRDDGRLQFVITPRFALSCSKELLLLAGKLSRELNLSVQTHLSENVDEIEAVRHMFPEHKDYLAVYEAFGLAHTQTIFAHSIHLSEDEWRRLATKGCSVSHCPDSNRFLGSGTFPWRKAEEHNVSIGLGSDVGAGRTYAMQRIASSAYDVALAGGHRKSPSSLCWHATRGGALAINRSEVGCLEEGYEADLIQVHVPGASSMTTDELFDAILFRDDVRITAVLVRGKTVHDQST